MVSAAAPLARQVSEVRHFASIGEEPCAQAHPKIVELIRYWQSLSPGPDLLPSRRRLDPSRIPALLPHIWLVDVVPDDPRRYRTRLVGNAILTAGGPFKRGGYFSDVMPTDEARAAVELCDLIVQRKHVDWRRGPSMLRLLSHIYAVERVMMPMAEDGATVDVIMCMTLFYWTDGRVY